MSGPGDGDRAPGAGPAGPPPGAERDPAEASDRLQRLWTPWRMAYVAEGSSRVERGCPFCVLPGRGPEHDDDSLILRRGRTGYLILNAYPYNPGHLMAVPYRHVPDLVDLDDEEVAELADLCRLAVGALRAASGPDGFNVGMNLGRVAGAGIADHVHQHVVPRWSGDTNFMPVVGQTRVLPQLLEETWRLLRPHVAEG